MLSRPSTDQVLTAIADDLQAVVAPAVSDEAATILLSQIDQLLRRQATRAAHEIGWMTEEIGAIDDALGRNADPADGWHLHEVLARYSAASAALGEAVETAFAADDVDRVSELRTLLEARIATEQQILGTLDLVGRG